ncbi:DEAD/DEAH box helicase family protein [Bacillus gobiensis]|uniref:DEAD/DEAH box helicase n=1 Tax=Bacillus gobiensis TaxID=1441095 RepID=UPI003D1D71EA
MSSIVWKNRSIMSSKLYPYQVNAIYMSLKYIKSNSNKHSIIKMPTGTGKTFVIGTLAYFINGINNVIIVAPSSAIRDNLYKELHTEMWNKMNIKNDHKKSVYTLFPHNITPLVNRQEKKIYITTIQALTEIKREKEAYFNKLKNSVNLILFDEGHKEPATTWNETIRAFEKKTILFTATPIRNDYQIFNIDEKYFFNYSIKNAIEESIIRSPKFKYIENEISTPEKKIHNFIDNVISLREEFIEKYNYSPKVIIRFANFEDLNIGIEYLMAKVEKAIAIHERFKGTKNSKYKFKNVPRENEADYWLAQNKLIEGIDNNKFALLGIFGAFDNARSLIQQIGRILRKDNKAHHLSKCWVIMDEVHSFQEDMWNTYLEYEKDISESNKLPTTNFKNYFKSFLSNQPNYIYGSKKFLKKFELENNFNFDQSTTRYNMPLRVNIFSLKTRTSFEYETLYDEIVKQKELSNEFILRNHKQVTENMSVVVYSKHHNSSILNSESFVEVKLGLFFLWLYDNYLFYYDTNSQIPNCIFEISEPISTNKLQLLFNENAEFTEVTLKNGLISYNNINRRVINSKDIRSIAPDFTDKYNFCTTVTGTIIESGNKSRRYIGFSNSRVSDGVGFVLLKDYLSWIRRIAGIVISGDSNKSDFFNRYAPVVGIPLDTNPLLITFNLSEFVDRIIDQNGNKVFISQKNYQIEDNKFLWEINGVEIGSTIKFENNRYKLKFDDSDLNRKYKFNENIITDTFNIGKNESLINYLNRCQDFHIVTNDGTHIYHRREFYRCEIPTNSEHLEPIFGEYKLVGDKKIKSEKGVLSTERKEWTEGSLFYLLSSIGADLEEGNEIKNALKEMDFLICTDLGTEIADFIGLDTKNEKIYFIHCKAKDATRSASVFQDICSQIIKNLDYVHPQSNRIPDRLEGWNDMWKLEKVQRKRVIKGQIEAAEIWDLIKKYQRSPASTTYVWGLTAKMFSLEEYRKQKLKGFKQYPEIIQIDYLLMNTWAAVQSVGAKFKFFFDKKA